MLSFFGKRSENRKSSKVTAKRPLKLENLEGRAMMTTFAVANLADAGAGSLRQAMLDANSHAGADTIEFDISGTINLKSALPTLTDEVDIDGSTAPGFAGTPTVQIDFNRYAGLKFAAGSDDSELRSLSLVDAAANGVTLTGVSGVQIAGNYIGLATNGSTVIANRGHGIEINHSTDTVVGGDDAGTRNVISGNVKHGVYLTGASANLVAGNYIGTDATGALDRGNKQSGVRVAEGSTNNVVGGGNVISGNDVHGVHISNNSNANKVSNNTIGLNAAGNAKIGNKLDGVKIENSSNNIVGHIDPVTGITYNDADNVTAPVSGWQGIRGGEVAGEYLITGTSDTDGLLYVGNIEGTVGDAFTFNVPGAYNTSAYGPDNLGGGVVRIVGSYKNPDYQTAPVTVNGFLYEGNTADFANPANYRTIDVQGAKYNFVHSTAGGLVVGNYDAPLDHGTHSLPFGPGHAYIYDIDSDTFLTDVVYPGSLSNSAYGIWDNGDGKFTIVGGYSLDAVENFEDQDLPIGKAFMVDYDKTTGDFTNWTTFEYPYGENYVTHFQGISSVEKGVYTLNADSVQSGTAEPAQGSWVTVRRNGDGSFGEAAWVNLQVAGYDSATNISSSNSVYGNQVVGIVIGTAGLVPFQATINEAFQLSNVISGNGSDGIELYAASNNQIAMNYIGTDVTGTIDLGNTANGIFVTASSTNNLIGGEITDGNDPTNGVFATPPQGNVISGNNGDGVLINSKSTNNQLSGNFIGTDESGNVALGNSGDGVEINKANGNILLGCTFQQDPFVFYNVISGNAGNGLRVKDSNDTTIQANFFGMGANNDTAVGNGMNGVVVEGTSTRTVMGGPIPLGNVVAANVQNGVVVKDKASQFTAYNTFTGLAAFSDDPSFGNGQDGMLITSTGGDILLRTNVITRNGDDGIEVSGSAKGVRIAGNIIGLNTDGTVPMGNADNGIEIGGKASNITVGGPQPTFNVIPQNIIGSNHGAGVAILGKAFNNTVSHSWIGIDYFGTAARGNDEAGVYLGSGSYNNTIGSVDPDLLTVISGNHGHGIEMNGAKGNTVLGTLIGLDADGDDPLGNDLSGIYLTNSSNNTIGGTEAGEANTVANNGSDGVVVASGNGNAIRQNSIYDNVSLGIRLLSGANSNQAAPVLTSVTTNVGGIEVTGTLTSKPKTTFTIEFFSNADSDREGQTYLGSQTVTTNSAGVAAFTWEGPSLNVNEDFITATATDSKNNTSEFSVAVS